MLGSATRRFSSFDGSNLFASNLASWRRIAALRVISHNGSLAPIDLFEEVCEQKQLAIRHRGVAEKPYVEQVPGDFQCLGKRFAAIDEDRFAKQLLLRRFGHDRQRLSRVLHLLHSGSLEPLHGRVSASVGRTVQAPRER